MKNYMDTSLTARERAEILLKEMTLDEKIAQLTGVFSIKGREKEMAAFFKNGIGQISTLGFRTCESMDEAAEWQRKLQTAVMENSRLHIPAVFHMEGLCGAFIQDTTSFPSGVNRGAAFDPELERKIGEIVSRQEAAWAPPTPGEFRRPRRRDGTRSRRPSILRAFTGEPAVSTAPMWRSASGCSGKSTQSPSRRRSRRRIFAA